MLFLEAERVGQTARQAANKWQRRDAEALKSGGYAEIP